jgi:hypothetical protein
MVAMPSLDLVFSARCPRTRVPHGFVQPTIIEALQA